MDPLAYLTGVYEPVDAERTAEGLRVTGELPRELHGMYVQANPNPRFPPDGMYHWFDGDGMVHGVHLDGGRAMYRNRWVRTAGLAREEEAGRPLWRGIMMDFDPTAEAPDKDTANTDLIAHGGRLYATWWLGGQPMELAVPTLDTVGPATFGGSLTMPMAAHPKVDPRTGELVFFDYDPYSAPYLRMGVIDRSGRQVHATDVHIPAPSLFHDIAITEHYTVLMDLPMVWDPVKLAQGKRRVRFHADRPSRFGIVERRGTQVRWFEAPPCYSYHTINAWESTNDLGHPTVELLACRIENPVPRNADEEDGIPRLAFLRLEPYLCRWTFDLETGAVSEQILDDVPTEFPRMNDALLGVRSRYSWNPRVRRGATLAFDGVVKYDTDAGTSSFHAWGDGSIGGETVFVPRPGGSAEDDGWVTAFVSDLATRQSALVVLDAATLDEVARVHLPHRVPFGFHAHWIDVPGVSA